MLPAAGFTRRERDTLVESLRTIPSERRRREATWAGPAYPVPSNVAAEGRVPPSTDGSARRRRAGAHGPPEGLSGHPTPLQAFRLPPNVDHSLQHREPRHEEHDQDGASQDPPRDQEPGNRDD